MARDVTVTSGNCENPRFARHSEARVDDLCSKGKGDISIFKILALDFLESRYNAILHMCLKTSETSLQNLSEKFTSFLHIL